MPHCKEWLLSANPWLRNLTAEERALCLKTHRVLETMGKSMEASVFLLKCKQDDSARLCIRLACEGARKKKEDRRKEEETST